MTFLTTDTFFNGRILVLQEQDGYRYSIDAVILAYHAGGGSSTRVLDLGTGCGIIPMILAFRDPLVRIFAVEVQASLAKLAMENIEANRMADRVTILAEDMKTLRPEMTGGPVDLVVVNPPFYKVDTGRVNPNPQRAVARHELRVTLSDVTATASRMLQKGGRFLAIYTAERLCDMIAGLRAAGIEPKWLRMIQSADHAAAGLVLVEGMKGGSPGVKIPPPLIIYDSKGRYTEEVSRMFQY
ncbi:MAG: tRNA1(Val) (adenine(37)-N6)-methyltransferase [Pseudomonadota bacterium]